MLVPNRHASSAAYRYGFQGQEKDDEIKGEGNSLNYKFRMHDPRVGRFFAVDPLTMSYPWYTPYSFSGNKVISHTELEGLEEDSAITNRDWTWRFYRVQLTDNLTVISKTTGVSIEDILRYNPSIENPDLIYEGQFLDLNGGSALTPDDFVFDRKLSKFEQVILHLASNDETGPSLQSMTYAVMDPIGTAIESSLDVEIPDELHYAVAAYRLLKGKIPRTKKGKVNLSKSASDIKGVTVKAGNVKFTKAGKDALFEIGTYPSHVSIKNGIAKIKIGFSKTLTKENIALVEKNLKANGAKSMEIGTGSAKPQLKRVLKEKMKQGRKYKGFNVEKSSNPLHSYKLTKQIQ